MVELIFLVAVTAIAATFGIKTLDYVLVHPDLFQGQIADEFTRMLANTGIFAVSTALIAISVFLGFYTIIRTFRSMFDDVYD